MKLNLTIAANDTIAQQHCDAMLALLRRLIADQGGHISFAEYMQRCLYQPGLGYYSAGSHKLGQGGDFTTAPEISPLFAASLANHVHDALQQTQDKHILEFGAGTGQMATDMLRQLAQLKALPVRYFIIEASADLRERQQQNLAANHPNLYDRIEWLDSVPDAFSGVIVANEVCDAMPVHLLHFTADNIYERCVTVDDEGNPQWQDCPISCSRLLHKASLIRETIGPVEFFTEVNLLAEDWLQTVADSFRQGALFIIDYGYPFTQYYQPERDHGTLMCYYRQQGHDNPLILAGLQDITAHVDFTSLAETALSAGLDVAAFHEQGEFLLAGGISELAQQLQLQSSVDEWLQHSASLKQLLLPGQMGHQFKVLSLSKALAPLPRLQLQDRRYQL